ncbi:MAG TPA: hypothetical protein VKY90_12710 [Candidatus Dormibacteraeota bacterium]|nr:hypothetical protein [Candidatus Dormibacteraeota bacterium]
MSNATGNRWADRDAPVITFSAIAVDNQPLETVVNGPKPLLGDLDRFP